MTTTIFTAAELEADRKQVYKVDGLALIALADKYGVASRAMVTFREEGFNRDSFYSEAAYVTGTKAGTEELRKLVYKAIKGLQA